MIGIDQLDKVFQKGKAYKDVFKKDNESVKRVICDLAKECKAFESTMCKDQYDTAFNEGKRSVYLYILRNINIDLSQLQELIELERQSENL